MGSRPQHIASLAGERFALGVRSVPGIASVAFDVVSRAEGAKFLSGHLAMMFDLIVNLPFDVGEF